MQNTTNRGASNQAKAPVGASLEAYVDGLVDREARRPRITAKILEQELGHGDTAYVTRKLYGRLERGCEKYGPKYEKIVRDCGRAARLADRPAAYFSVAVTRRLRESGFEL